jgi:predicted lysophospholipase L1 biosynthesis ABC-type transport system permease subunit
VDSGVVCVYAGSAITTRSAATNVSGNTDCGRRVSISLNLSLIARTGTSTENHLLLALGCMDLSLLVLLDFDLIKTSLI